MNVTIDWFAVKKTSNNPRGLAVYEVFVGQRSRGTQLALSYDDAINKAQHS
jgi:hypothetical protein